MNDAVSACLAGTISPEIALARMLLARMSPNAIVDAIAAARNDSPAWHALEAARARHVSALPRLAALAGSISHESGDITAMFDTLAAASPDAGAAFYALGDPALLARATQEVIQWLAGERLIGLEADVLDFGCGPGRLAAAAAPRCRSVLGTDISPGMIAEASRRHGTVPNLGFAVVQDRILPPGCTMRFDLVLMADVMPYLIQKGGNAASRAIEDCAMHLRPGGAIAIANLSYRGDTAADRSDAEAWAARHGMRLAIANPFRLWDASAFVLRARP